MAVDFKTAKIGLVLSGGGAKGAYQIGCWKAMRNAGIEQFAVISGASVGALNAMLIAAGKLDRAESLWSEISRSKVLGFEWKKALFFPLWLLCALYVYRFGPPASRHPEWRIWQKFSRFGALALFAGSCGVLIWSGVSVQKLTAEILAIPPIVWEYWSQHADLFMWLAFFLIMGAMGERVSRTALTRMATTNKPLAQLLREKLPREDARGIDIPVYLTLSRLRPYTWDSMSCGGWVPEYVKVDCNDYEAIQCALLQSAGLPGIFPIMKVFGEDAIDGGYTDNSPVAPLLFGPHQLDLIIVIYLQSDSENEIKDVLQWAKDKWRTFTLTQLGESKARRIDKAFLDGDSDAYVPYSGGNGPFPEILEVTPSEPMGNFIEGTLNFSAERARSLIRLGESDMKLKLQKITADQIARGEVLSVPCSAKS